MIRGLALGVQSIKLRPPDSPVVERRADESRCRSGLLQGDELFESRNTSANARRHRRMCFAEPVEELVGSCASAGPDARKIQEEQVAGSQVNDLPR